jgi:AcrR family transcriptional regulator
MPPPSFRDYRLPRGNHGLSRAQVIENQRWRLLGAASELLAERRLTGLSSRVIARRAGVSSHTFYEHFEDVDALLAAAFANACQVVVELIAAACAGASDHREQIGKAVAAAVSLGDEDPGLASLFRVEVGVGIPEVGAERERLVARLVALSRNHGKGAYGRATVTGAVALVVRQVGVGALGDRMALGPELALLLD